MHENEQTEHKGKVDRGWFSPAEYAQHTGASRAWVYLRMQDGTIPSVKLAGRRFIPADHLAQLLAGGDAA